MEVVVDTSSATSSVNLLEEFKSRVEEAMDLVARMSAEDTVEAVQYWNVFSERLQELVYHTAEVAEIEAIEAMALDLEQTNVPSNSAVSSEAVTTNSDSLPIITSNIDQDSRCSTVAAHELTCHSKSFSCSVCKAKFSTKNNLLVHEKKHNEQFYTCQKVECNAKFHTKGNLLRHTRTHSGNKPWECSICLNRFTERKSLKVHMRKHTGERPYSCTICNKSFAQSGILSSHLAMHMNSKSFCCDQCGRAFRQKSQLKLHLQRHAGIRRFSCPQCDYKFLTKGDMERHQRTHTGERPFNCKLCGKSYTRQQSLKEHINRHYGQKPYSCKHCFKAFAEMSACYKHIKSHKVSENTTKDDTTNADDISTLIVENNLYKDGGIVLCSA
ncbi:uncharacterized protein LOC142323669 isoform X5 [Lycorma delicatula]|uniref:uncharacterized protein LOC142323669 isoform X5 n=1 Tax=Lycorma delicatula TaxID=130591 RepID=UPI003F51857A